MSHMSAPGAVSTGTFTRARTPRRQRGPRPVLAPGHDGIGWLAQRGFVPLGYLGDAEKTARRSR